MIKETNEQNKNEITISNKQEIYINNNTKNINNINNFNKNILNNQKYKDYYQFNFNLENNNKIYNSMIPSTQYIIRMSILLSKEKIGSKLVQMEYEGGNDEIKNEIFETLKKQIVPLSEDTFGNYVIQKILFSGDIKKIDYIFDSIKGFLLDLSIHQNGCRVLQALIEILGVLKDKFSSGREGQKCKEKLEIITEILIKNISNLLYDQNGNHVIQKLIDALDGDNINGIYSEILNYIQYDCKTNLLFNKYVSRIVQNLLYKLNELQKEKENNNLIDIICDNNFDEICKNQYSNYILQLIIENHKDKIEFICNKLKGNIYNYSLDNYASYIIQKIIEIGNSQQRDQIGKEIIENNKSGNNEENSIMELVKHKNGNFVIQKVIQFCSSDIKNQIIKKIKINNYIKRGKYSKYVCNIIDRYNCSN